MKMRRYVYWVVAEEEAELVLLLGWVPSQDPWGLGFPEIASFHEAAVAEGAEEMSAEMEELCTTELASSCCPCQRRYGICGYNIGKL